MAPSPKESRPHGAGDNSGAYGRLFVQLPAAGLQPGKFDVFATLRRSGDPYMLSPTRLYEAAMISSGGMTNRLDRLERAGLIERRSDPCDRGGELIHRIRPGQRRVRL